MPDTRIICIGTDVKTAILDRVNSREISAQIQSIPECKLPDAIELSEVKRTRRGGAERVKRAPSAYNLFIGSCLKNKHIKGFRNAAPALRECAVEWKQKKNG
jgi:hypothetical protein